MSVSLFDTVIEHLRADLRPLALVASECGVPYFTLQKWVRTKGRTLDPQVGNVQKVADYYGIKVVVKRRRSAA